MALTATTNTAANTALRYLQQNGMNSTASLGKLSSGSRIVKASDDAASLAVATKVRADVTALKQAQVNTSQASSMLQVADGGMARIGDILQRMKSLAVQSSSGQLTDTERGYLNEEYTQLRTQVGDIAEQTKFNGRGLINGAADKQLSADATQLASFGITAQLSGPAASGTFSLAFDAAASQFTLTSPEGFGGTQHTIQFATDSQSGVFEGTVNFDAAGIKFNLQNFMPSTDGLATAVEFNVTGSGTLSFQVGAASTDDISLSIRSVTVTELGLTNDIDTSANAALAGDQIDTAISTVSTGRAELGAVMSRFESISANLATSIENLDAARSTLMDVDMASEMSKFSSSQVMMQASVAMLAQANQMPQNLLRLLG
jgi:flagellin